MIEIRPASKQDAQSLLNIYAYYVEQTAITFEYDIPTAEEFEKRIETTLKRYPYLVAVEKSEASQGANLATEKESGNLYKKKDHIVGYAYASAFKGRKAYDYAVETTVYVDKDNRGQTIGTMLYQALEDQLKRQNVCNVNACIAFTENEDQYLTNDSQHFHEHMGYRLVGTFHQCGYKFDRWYDMIWMEKMIGKHEIPMKPFVPYAILH